jgi:hypothetical protein
MTRKTPNIVLMEYSLRGVLDTLFAPKIQQLLFNQVVDGIQKAIKDNKKELVVCDINQLETSIAISKPNFISALKSSLDYCKVRWLLKPFILVTPHHLLI